MSLFYLTRYSAYMCMGTCTRRQPNVTKRFIALPGGIWALSVGFGVARRNPAIHQLRSFLVVLVAMPSRTRTIDVKRSREEVDLTWYTLPRCLRSLGVWHRQRWESRSAATPCQPWLLRWGFVCPDCGCACVPVLLACPQVEDPWKAKVRRCLAASLVPDEVSVEVDPSRRQTKTCLRFAGRLATGMSEKGASLSGICCVLLLVRCCFQGHGRQ